METASSMAAVYLRPRVVARGFIIALVVQACGGSSLPALPMSPTPPTQQSADLSGAWLGEILWGSPGDEGQAEISLTLAQTGASITGTFACVYVVYGCALTTATLSGTVSGTTLTGRLVFPSVFPTGACDFNGTLSGQRLTGTFACNPHVLGTIDGYPFGEWEVAPAASKSSRCVPELISPANNAVLDNGRTDGRDGIVWQFDWTDCPDATQYQLFFSGADATIPFWKTSTQSSHRHAACAYIAEQNRFNWRWKVRARTGGLWGNWTEERFFNAERSDSDPPLGCE